MTTNQINCNGEHKFHKYIFVIRLQREITYTECIYNAKNTFKNIFNAQSSVQIKYE